MGILVRKQTRAKRVTSMFRLKLRETPLAQRMRALAAPSRAQLEKLSLQSHLGRTKTSSSTLSTGLGKFSELLLDFCGASLPLRALLALPCSLQSTLDFYAFISADSNR